MLDLTLNMALGFDTKNLKIIFFGTPEFVIPVLSILQENFQVVGIVTAPDKKVGRKQLLTSAPIKQFYLSTLSKAKKGPSGALILTPEKFTPLVVQQLSALQPDLFVVAAFGKIIPQNILDIPKFGCINIHPSLLPKYRGASPIQSAILNGDKVSGISIIKMDAEIDHGSIIYAEEFSLSPVDTFETLSTKMFLRSSEILLKIIPAFISGKLKLKRQDNAIAEYCRMVKKEDGYFDINNPPSAEILNRMIRAYYPWPTAWTKWSFANAQDKIVKFLPIPSHSELVSESSDSGIRQNDKREYFIQMEGKKPVPLKDFLNGYPNFPLKNNP